MSLSHRAYEGQHDFLRLLQFLSELNAQNPAGGHLQPGDLTWWMRQNKVFNPQHGIRLFEVEREIVGFVFNDPPTWAVIQAHPMLLPEDIHQLVAYAEHQARTSPVQGERGLTVRVFTGDAPVMNVLRNRHYLPTGAQSVLFRWMFLSANCDQFRTPDFGSDQC